MCNYLELISWSVLVVRLDINNHHIILTRGKQPWRQLFNLKMIVKTESYISPLQDIMRSVGKCFTASVTHCSKMTSWGISWESTLAQVMPCFLTAPCTDPSWWQGSWGQHGAHLGPTGPRWAPCWPHELCYLGRVHVAIKENRYTCIWK